MSGHSGVAKRVGACSQCRARKVKCNGKTPCSKCLNHSAECIYPGSRRGRKKTIKLATATLEDRLARMETMIQTQNRLSCTSEGPYPVNAIEESTLPMPTQPGRLANVDSVIMGPAWAETRSADSLVTGDSNLVDVSVARRHPAVTHSPVACFASGNTTTDIPGLGTHDLSNTMHKQPLSNPSNKHSGTTDSEASVLAPQMTNWEHHGPGSWLSVCSKPGLAWVAQRTGVNDFADSARELVSTWTGRLTLTRNKLLNPEEHEPDLDTAWKYSNAFFEDSPAAAFGVVHRPAFEAALRSHLKGDLAPGADPAWYALRKTVYASGCRIYKSKHTSTSFADIQTEAWGFFQCAMSVFTELLFSPTGLLAVRALSAMTFFSEGLGNPALEYMLCTNAARVAQAKGLHRRPADTWNLSKNDHLHFGWIFWGIYSIDKHIAHRSGRPSAIDDDDISCEIPTEICPGSTIDIQACTGLIRHAKISSQISRKLTSVKAFQQSPSSFLQTAMELDSQLREWRDSLPVTLRPADKLMTFQMPSNAKTFSMTHIHYAYYGALMAIHTMIAYPWIRSTVFDHDRSAVTQDQTTASSNIVADAARNIVVIARSLGIDAASVQWSTFYYPMAGLINLFIHVLRFPVASTARSDIALLDVIAGHFAHMEFVTDSELNFPFARNVAALARRTIDKASQVELRSPIVHGAEHGSDLYQEMEIPSQDFFNYSNEDFNLDDWGVFSSALMDGEPHGSIVGFTTS